MSAHPTTLDIVNRFYDAALTSDLAAIEPLLHPDVVVHEAPSLPYGGDYVGKETVLAFFAQLFSGIGLDSVVRGEVMTSGNRAIITLEVPFGFADPENPLTMPCLEAVVVEDGLITDFRPFYFDTAALNDTISAATA